MYPQTAHCPHSSLCSHGVLQTKLKATEKQGTAYSIALRKHRPQTASCAQLGSEQQAPATARAFPPRKGRSRCRQQIVMDTRPRAHTRRSAAPPLGAASRAARTTPFGALSPSGPALTWRLQGSPWRTASPPQPRRGPGCAAEPAARRLPAASRPGRAAASRVRRTAPGLKHRAQSACGREGGAAGRRGGAAPGGKLTRGWDRGCGKSLQKLSFKARQRIKVIEASPAFARANGSGKHPPAPKQLHA